MATILPFLLACGGGAETPSGSDDGTAGAEATERCSDGPEAQRCGGPGEHHGAEHQGGEHGHRHGRHDHGHHGQGAHHDFSDVERFAEIFDDPERDSWQKPDEVVGLLGLQPGQTVADLGAGTGYFLSRLSAAVGPEGAVLALDVEPNMVAHMEARIEREGLANATARAVPTDAPGLEPNSVDVILIVDTWHHIGEREAYAAKLFTALRPGGSVYVVDFTMDSPQGPPAEMRLTTLQVAEELGAAGFEIHTLEETLPHQYVVQATRPTE